MKHETVLTDEREICRRFAETHVAELADEAIEWQDSSVLRDGKLRELAKMCAPWTGSQYALSVAQNFATRAAWQLAKQAEKAQPVAWGCKCRVCGEWQKSTPSGMVCAYGHGGAPGINVRLYERPPTPSALLEAAEKFFGLQHIWDDQGVLPDGYWEASDTLCAAIEAHKKGQA
jgi:hypothetical protein